MGTEHLDRLSAENGNMARGSLRHTPSPGVLQRLIRKLDANGPIAPQISALRRAYPAKDPWKKARQGATAVPRPNLQTLISERNLLGCHGISNVKKGLGRPQTGSALHHLVTALSVKKALTIPRRIGALFNRSEPVMLPAHTPPKCEAGAGLPDCADDKVKE
jgi:hypothetical protein